MKKLNKLIKINFFILIILFIAIISGIFMAFLKGRLFLPSIFLFFLLGLTLVIFTMKVKIKKHKFLFLTGASAVLFFIAVILHNLLYALGILYEHISIIKYSTEILHVSFFLIATILCPLSFLVGTIGSIILFFRKKA